MSKRFPSTILSTAVVPWDEDYRFQEDLFRQQVQGLRQELTPYIYLFGTAGEGYAVSESQFDEIVDAFRDEMLPGAHPMVGLISLSLQTMVERIERCRERGIHAFQISLPGWGTLTDREVDIFFEQTCGRFPDCQFLHYNLPRTGRVLSADDYARLAPAHRNLVAVKFGGASDAELISELIQKVPQIQFFFTEFGYATARRLGEECGFLISMCISNFTRAREYFEARGARSEEMVKELEGMATALRSAVADRGHMDGVFDKMFTKIHIPEFPLRLLPPYTAAGDEQFEAFVAALPESWRLTDGPQT